MKHLLFVLLCENCCANQQWFDLTISLGEVIEYFLTVVGFIVAICQYQSSKKEERNLQNKNQKETWFLNVIVLPQLENINKFYSDLLFHINEDKIQIDAWKLENHMEFIISLSKLKSKRKQEINDFYDHIIALVNSYDIQLGEKMNVVVMGLEDDYVQLLDSMANGDEVKPREIVLTNKQNIITILNTGLRAV